MAPFRDAPPDTAALGMERLPAVEPLDAQFGVWPLRSAPEPLAARLFAGDGLRAYAVIDAARIPGFPGPGIFAPGRCLPLFDGAAGQDLSDAAPYLVPLEGGEDGVLRRLTTRSGAPGDLWDAGAAIFLRSAADPDDMRRHLRRFTRVRDETGAWFALRFWDQSTLQALLQALTAHPGLLSRFLFLPDGTRVETLLAPRPDELQVMTNRMAAPLPSVPIRIDGALKAALAGGVIDRFERDFAATLFRTMPRQMRALGLTDPWPLVGMIAGLRRDLGPAGLVRRSDIARFAVCGAFYGSAFHYDPRLRGLLRAHLTGTPFASANAKRAEKALASGPLHARVTTASGLRAIAAGFAALPEGPPTPAWMGRWLTPDWGFDDTETIRVFLGACEAASDEAALTDAPRRAGHFLFALLYGPWWIADPIHARLADLIAGPADFARRARAEIARRLSVSEERDG